MKSVWSLQLKLYRSAPLQLFKSCPSASWLPSQRSPKTCWSELYLCSVGYIWHMRWKLTGSVLYTPKKMSKEHWFFLHYSSLKWATFVGMKRSKLLNVISSHVSCLHNECFKNHIIWIWQIHNYKHENNKKTKIIRLECRLFLLNPHLSLFWLNN